jgi:hypothetical protein
LTPDRSKLLETPAFPQVRSNLPGTPLAIQTRHAFAFSLAKVREHGDSHKANPTRTLNLLNRKRSE